MTFSCFDEGLELLCKKIVLYEVSYQNNSLAEVNQANSARWILMKCVGLEQ